MSNKNLTHTKIRDVKISTPTPFLSKASGGEDSHARSYKKRARVRFLRVLSLLALFIMAVSNVSAADATLALSPSTHSVNMAETVTVEVAISGVETPVAAVGFVVGYDVAKLAFVSADSSDWLTTGDRTTTCSAVHQDVGEIGLACASAGEGDGVTADGTLATLTFTAIGVGSADLTLTAQLADTAVPPNELTADTTNATITIGTPTNITLNQLATGQQRALLVWLGTLLLMTLAAGAYLLRQRKRHGLVNLLMVMTLLAQLAPVQPVSAAVNPPDVAPEEIPPVQQPRFAASTPCFVTNLDCDRDVDSADLRLIADRWGCDSADSCYLPAYDLDSDNAIDLYDLAWVGNDYDIAPPDVSISTPAADTVLTGATISVSGTISDDHAITAVSVNDVAATLDAGSYHASVPASGGTQLLTVAATDALGRTAFVERLVTVDNGAPLIEIAAPKDRQAVYTTTPTVGISHSDFESAIDVATFGAVLTTAGGGSVDVSADFIPNPDGATGSLSAPLTPAQTYTLTVQIADEHGNVGTATTTFYVAPADIAPPIEPEDAGWVSGVVYDSAECNAHLEGCEPLAGAEVELLQIDLAAMDAIRAEQAARYNTAEVDHNPLDLAVVISATETVTGTIVTGPDGYFAFPVAETAVYFVRVEKDGFTYAQREVAIVKQKSTAINRLYLTGLDSAETQCTDAGCTHQSSDNALQLDIPAGAIPSGETYPINATLFENVEFLPSGELPPNTWETYAFNLGGDSEITFTMPITVRVANTVGFAAGTEIPMGYWNQVTQAWEHAGVSTVDATGQWVVGQVTHFSNYDWNQSGVVTYADIDQAAETENENEEEDGCEEGESGCFIGLNSGELTEWIDLPAVRVLGEAVAPRLRYSSDLASPAEVIDIKLNVTSFGSALPAGSVGYEMYIAGELTDAYTVAADFATVGEIGRFRYYWDGRDASGNRVPAGSYPYRVRFAIPVTGEYCLPQDGVFGNPPDCENSNIGITFSETFVTWAEGIVTVDPQPDSALGAGWVFDQQERLYAAEDGQIMISDGTREDAYYSASFDLLETVAEGESGIVSWVDGESNTLQVATETLVGQSGYVKLDAATYAVEIGPDGRHAYVVTYDASDNRTYLNTIDLESMSVTESYQIGRAEPWDAAISLDGTTLYVTFYSSSRFVIIDLATQAITRLFTGNGPRHITLNSDGSLAYVADTVGQSITIFDLATNGFSDRINLANAYDVALSPDDSLLYVTQASVATTMSVIDVATQQVLATYEVGQGKKRVVLAPDGNTAYVTVQSSNELKTIDLTTGTIESAEVIDSVDGIVLADDGATAYLMSNAIIAKYDLASGTIVAQYAVGDPGSSFFPYSPVLSPDESQLFMVNAEDSINDGLRVVDLASQQTVTSYSIDANSLHAAIALPSQLEAFVIDDHAVGYDEVHVVNLATGAVAATITVGDAAIDIVAAVDQSTVYVANFGSDNVHVIDVASRAVVDTLSATGPYKLATGASGTLYVLEHGGNLKRFQNNLLQDTIVLGGDLSGLAISADETVAAIVDDSNWQVKFVDLTTGSSLGNVALSLQPYDVAISADNSTAYVTQYPHRVSTIDIASGSETGTFDTIFRPAQVEANADASAVFIGGQDGVAVLDTATGAIRSVFYAAGYGVQNVGYVAGGTATAATVESLYANDYASLAYDFASETYTRTHKDGRQVHFNLDGTHDFTLHPTGKREQFRYNDDGSIASFAIIAPGAESADWTWTFNTSNGKLANISDPAGRSVDFSVNAAGQLVDVTQPDGAVRQFSYTADHLMTHQTNERGLVTSYAYDDYGRITTITDPIREIYDPVTGTHSVTQTVRTITASETGYLLLNEMETGSFDVPVTGLPTSADLRDSVSYGRGGRSGLTNSFGSWTEVADGIGRITTISRDDANNILQRTAPDGDCEMFTYDALGNPLTRSILPACASRTAQTWTYSYESRFNQIKTATDPLGNTTTFVYDYETGAGAAGNVVNVIQPAVPNEFGITVTPTLTYTYNALGLLATEIDARGMVTQYSYSDGSETDDTFASGVPTVPGLLTEVIKDVGGENLTSRYRQYDALGNAQLEIAAGNTLTTAYTFDPLGRPLTVTDAEGKITQYEYDAQGNRGRMVRDAGGRNVETTYEYDSAGRLSAERTVADGLTVGEERHFDINGLLTAVSDGNGNMTTLFYDDADQLVQIVDAAGYSSTLTYNADGTLATVTDADGYLTAYGYDGYGRRNVTTLDVGGANLTTLTDYDLNNNVIATTDPTGTQTCHTYDSHQRRTATIRDCGGANLTTSLAYDRNGNVVYETDERGVVTYREYDALNRLTRSRNDDGGLNIETVSTFNAAGLLATTTDPRGTVTAQHYDVLNRVASVCQDATGLNLCTTYTYDRLSNVATATDPAGTVTAVTTNAFGKPTVEIKDANGLAATTTLVYDDALNLIGVTDDAGNELIYQFDARNDLSAEQYADGTTLQYSYDGRGNEIGRILRDGHTISNTLDGAGRPTQRTFSNGDVQTFAYDGLNRITQADQTSDGQTTQVAIRYDAVGSPLSTTQTVNGSAWTTTFAPDHATGSVTTTYPAGSVRVQTVDALRRFSTVRDGAGSLIGGKTYFDGTGVQTLSFGNGLVTEVVRDEIGRITTIEDGLRHYAYGYDAASNLTYQQHVHRTDSPTDVYAYDGLYQLSQVWYSADATAPISITTAATQQSYTNDTRFNRQSLDGTTYSADSMNRYTSVDGTALSYDTRGNLLNDGRHTYSYDLLNRQTGMDGATYIYDALNRRVAKIVDGVQTTFVYDDKLRVIEAYDDRGALQATFTYGAGIDEPLLLEMGGTSIYYHQDAIGNVSELSDGSGNLVEQMRYDVFGAVTIADASGTPLAASAVGNPYLFHSRRLDSESDNYYFRNRIYSAEIGRFLQMDPLGYVDGVNVYQYVGNRPTNQTDPLGLFAIKAGVSFEGILAVVPIVALPGLFAVLKGFASAEAYQCCAGGSEACCKAGKSKVEVWFTTKVGFSLELSYGLSVKLKPKVPTTAADTVLDSLNSKPKTGGSGVGTGIGLCPSRGCRGVVELFVKVDAGVGGFGYVAEVTWPIYPTYGSPTLTGNDFGYVGASGASLAAGARAFLQCNGRPGDVFDLF